MRRPRRPVPRPTVRTTHYPAPIGGINTIDGGTAMPPQDAMYLYNLLAAEYGVRSRLGYREWAINLTGNSDNTVRAVLAFSASNPTNDKLFAVTSTGIWDVSASGTAPTQSIAFTDSTGDAGWGTYCMMSTPAGRFLLYTDEQNGLYIYNEGGSWAKVALGVAQGWAPLTTYLVNDQVTNGGKIYKCTVAGVSASSGGPTGTTTGIVDGSVTWNYISASSTSIIGPSLADQEAGFTGDPAKFVFVTVWKSRVWLVEKNSTRAWYLNTNSVYGVATSFDFGPKMRAGGPLRGLYDWSYDGGNGLDTLLVGISGAGDVIIYQGTDPSSINTFGIKGSWFVGGIPAGRRIATNYGGELLITSLIGIIPLSKLVVGRDPADWRQYETAKITNLFNDLASQRQGINGWALIVHPTDNALLVLVPTSSGAATEQLAMSFGTKGWSRYRDLPILSAASWNGALYFGTADGRVCHNTDYADNVRLQVLATLTQGTPQAVTLSGAPTVSGTYVIQISTSGTEATAQFIWSSNNGATYSAPVAASSSGVVLGSTGVTATFATGTYTSGQQNTYDVEAGGSSTPVSYSGLTAFRDEDGNQKRVQMIRPTVIAQGAQPLLVCVAKYNFDTEEPTAPNGSPAVGSNTWDGAKWDVTKWEGSYNASQPLGGGTGMGRNVAVAFVGSATSRTVVVGFDVYYDEGWQL